MNILKSDKTLFVDVDDTLVIWNETHATWRPHRKHIELIKRFHARGQPVVIWSAGGWEWALKVVQELQLEPYVHSVLSKPAWWVDDLPADKVLTESTRIFLKE